MIFIYKKWDKFCKKLRDNGIKSIRVSDCYDINDSRFLVLKHDVETDVRKAYELAKIENKYGHKGTYYVQAYLINNSKNIEILKTMQEMGHEISYHYDVLDSNKGDIEKAIEEFRENVNKFESNGFLIKTLCQHGNPVIEREGYTSNRDFFRSAKVQELYGYMCDVMVDLKTKANVDYDYYSDAGRQFKFIFDPITNDIVNSDDKNISYKDLNHLYDAVTGGNNVIISTHPHRWTKYSCGYLFHNAIFKAFKFVAKQVIKIPVLKKVASRYYYLAKKL